MILKNKKKSVIAWIYRLLFSLSIIYAFFLDYPNIDPSAERAMSNFIWWIPAHLIIGMILVLLMTCVFYYAGVVETQPIKYEKAFAVFVTIWSIVGKITITGIPFSYDIKTLIAIGVSSVGFFLAYLFLYRIIYKVLHCNWQIPLPTKIRQSFLKKPWFYSFVALLIFWIPHLIIKYPAGVCWDAAWQIEQGLRIVPLTTHHPLFHTLLMSWFIKFGMLFQSRDFGIFMFVVVEAIILAAIVSYGIKVILNLGAKIWTIVVILIFFALSPFVCGYVGQVIKDVYYTAFFLLFEICLIQYCFKRNWFWHSRGYLLMISSTILMCLFRNNGIYIVIPTIFLMGLFEIKRNSSNRIKKIGIFTLAVVLPIVFNNTLMAVYRPQKGSIAEALSLPFQQTARFVQIYDSEIPSKEQRIINRVLPYDQLKTLYNPYISDPVKGRFNRNATKKDLSAYIRVWVKQGLRHPLCYIKATMIQNYLMFYPLYNNYSYYVNVNSDHYAFHHPIFSEQLQVFKFQEKYKKALSLLHEMPGFFTLNNAVSYILLAVIVYGLMMGCGFYKWETNILFVPLLFSFLVVVAGPCYRGHVRYVFPIVYTVLFLTSLYTIFNTYVEKNE